MKFSKLLAYMLMLCVLFTVAFVAVAEEADVKPCEHVYEEEILKIGSCTVKGITKVECTKCGEITYEAEYVHGATVAGYIEADCVTNQFATETCSLCKEVVVKKEIPGTKLGHKEYVKDDSTGDYKPMTCKQDGYVLIGCERCDYEEKRTIPSPGSHKYEPTTIKTADCVYPAGKKLEICSVCGYYSESLTKQNGGTISKPALGHTWKDDNTEETCSATGIANRQICEVCGVVNPEKKGTVVEKDAAKHDPDKIELLATLKPATCTTTGIGKYICLDCGANIYAIIEDGHSYDDGVVTKEATCGADGEKKFTCKVCGETKTEVIKATGKHAAYEYGYSNAKCTEYVKAGEYCTVCGAVKPNTKVAYVTDKDGNRIKGEHKFEVVESTIVAAECEKAGSYTEKCSVCKLEEVRVIAAEEHAYGEAVLCEATCEYFEGYYEVCAKCGARVEVSVTGDKKAEHKYEVVVIKAATCTVAGEQKEACKVCGEDKANSWQAIPAGCVAKVTDVLKAATCTTTGLGKYTCEVCKKDLGYKVIPAGHKFGEAVVTTPATHTADGVKTSTCTVCGETKTEVIPADATNCKTTDEVHLKATCERNEMVGLGCAVCQVIKSGKVELKDTKLYHNPAKIYNEIKAATCTTDGVADIYCDMCGKDINDAPIAKLGHKYGEEVVLPADCVNNERIVKICEVCEDVLFVEDVKDGDKATGHDFEKTDKLSSCKTVGYTDREICTVCGEANPKKMGTEIKVNKNNHDDEPGKLVKTIKAATCTENGIGKYECGECGKDLGYKTIAAGHVLDNGTVIVERTCGVAGKTVYACVNCDYTEEVTVKATGKHLKYVDKVVPATCGQNEKAGMFCEVCGAAKKGTVVEIPGTALEHDWKVEVVEAATCKKAGKGVAKCSVCNEVDEEYVIEKLDHEEVKGELIEATCEHGIAYEMSCKNCDTKWLEELEGDNKPVGHKYVSKELPADCWAGASKGRFVCSVCGEVDPARPGVRDTAEKIPSAHVRELIEVVKPATCSEAGIAKYGKCANADHQPGEVAEFEYRTFYAEHTWSDEKVGVGDEAILYKTCTVCGAVEVVLEDTEEACEHNFVNVKAVAATEEKPGMTAGIKCDKCGLVLEGCEPVAFVPAHTHTEETIPAVAPTCTKEGATEGKICTVCGEVTVAPEVVAKIAHTEEVINHVSPTCAATGLTAGKKCSVCGEILVAQVVVEKLAHTEVAVEAVAPTCAATGLTAGKKCSVCGEVIEAQEVVEKLAHTEEEIAAVEATCTATGLTAGKKCTVCGEITVKQEEVAKLAHTEEEIAAVAATCTEAGLTAGKKCSVCGEITVKQEAVEALGHTEVELAAVAATCDKAGLTAGKKCSVCDVITVAQEEIPALGHTYTVSWDFNADCTKKVKISTCTVCGHVHTEEMDF